MIYDKHDIKLYEREYGIVVGNEFYPNSEKINICIPKLLVGSTTTKQEKDITLPKERFLNKNIKLKSIKSCNYITALNINSMPEQFDFDLVNDFKLEGETEKEDMPLNHTKEPTHPKHTHVIKKPFTLEKGVISNIYREKLPAGTKVLVSFIGGNLDDVVIDYIFDILKKR